MPQLLVLVVAGAGLVAGYKWLSKKVTEHIDALEAQAEAARGPKELGQLEWDAEAQVYRPARR